MRIARCNVPTEPPRRTTVLAFASTSDQAVLQQLQETLRRRGISVRQSWGEGNRASMEPRLAAMMERYQTGMIERGRHHVLECWDEHTSGERGREALRQALERARVVMLLLSPAFLASDVLGQGDLPQLVQEAQAAGARVLPILLRLAEVQSTPFGHFPAFNAAAGGPGVSDDREPEDLWRRLGRVVAETLRTPYPLETTRLIYSGHADAVRTLCWSPDGSRLASGGGTSLKIEEAEAHDFRIQVWEARTGKPLVSYGGHSEVVGAVAWSPDGVQLASASYDGTMQMWQAETGHSLLTNRGLSGEVLRMAWSPDGTRLATAGSDKTVQVWEARTETRLLTYRGHAGDVWMERLVEAGLPSAVRALAWSPDGRRIASGGDRTVQVWEAESGTRLLTYRGHKYWVGALAWSPDGQRLASVSHGSSAAVEVWEAETGQPLCTYRNHRFGVRTLAWAPDGRRLVSAGGTLDHDVQVWEAVSGKCLYTYTGHLGPVHTVAWSPDGSRIASAGDDRTVQIWQAP